MLMSTQQVSITPLERVIRQHQAKNRSLFQPTPEFYTEIGMSHIRFGKLRKGTGKMNLDEAQALADFFKVPVTAFFDQLQSTPVAA